MLKNYFKHLVQKKETKKLLYVAGKENRDKKIILSTWYKTPPKAGPTIIPIPLAVSKLPCWF